MSCLRSRHTAIPSQKVHPEHPSVSCLSVSQLLTQHQPGFQVCATISTFQQLEQLNGGKKIDGLTVSLSVSPEGKVDVAIKLPKSFRVSNHDRFLVAFYLLGLS